MNSLTRLMNAAICIPDFSSISRRSIDLPRHTLRKALQPGSLVVVDSTGLKVYGKDLLIPRDDPSESAAVPNQHRLLSQSILKL